VNWTREVNLREAQISALEKEVARLKAQSRVSRTSTLFEEDDPRPRPKYEKPRTFNGEYSPLYNLLNWLHSMKSYCAQHKCRDEDMVGLARTYMGPDVQAYLDAKYKGTLPEDWDELEKTLKLRYMPFDHKVRIELRFDALRQRSSLQAYMDEFQKVDAAFSFADMVVTEERKILVFIRGIKLSEDRRYIMHQKPQTLDACYEAAIYLRQTKVLDEGMYWGKNSKGRNSGDQEEKQERRMRKLEGEAKRKAWEEGRCLGCGEKGHLIATCPKVRYAKRILKRLDRALKGGYTPKGEKKGQEGKPKRHLRLSASKEESEEDSGPTEGEEEEPSEDSSPSEEDQDESGNDSPGSD
jgi:hypothetical protein